MVREFTNWDRFKDDKSICNDLGCDDDDKYYCCPDLDCSLCKPKQRFLKHKKVTEKELDSNMKSLKDLL